jgi:hypothetical protein
MSSLERHFSVTQVALRRNLSHDTIRRMFICEPGVMVYTKKKPNKRIYRTLRIPESVEHRVFTLLTNSNRSARGRAAQ